MFRFTTIAVIVAAALALAAPALAQQTYTLTDVAPSNEVIPILHIYINASGHIVGFNQVNGSDAAWIWNPSSANATTGTFAWLPVPSGTTVSWATGINSAGQVVGTRTYASGTYKFQGKKYVNYVTAPVEWQANGAEMDLLASSNLGTLELAINDAGEIAGASSLWSGGKSYLMPAGQAASINKSGQVAGVCNDGTGATGYLWTPSAPNGTSGTYVTFPFRASHVNDLGQVVGYPYPWDADGAPMPALFSISGGIQYLAPQGTYGHANGINNLTQVVGDITINNATVAYLWDSANGLRRLNDSTQFTIVNGAGWSFSTAEGINDYGQIVGWGINPSGAERFFLLTPK